MIRTSITPIRLFPLLSISVMAASSGALAMGGMAISHSGEEMTMPQPPSGGRPSSAKAGMVQKARSASPPGKVMSRGQKMDGMIMDDMDDMSDMPGMKGMEAMGPKAMPSHPEGRSSGRAAPSGLAEGAGKAASPPTGNRWGKGRAGMEGMAVPRALSRAGKPARQGGRPMGGMVMAPAASAAASASAPASDKLAAAVKKPRIVYKAVDAPAPVVDLGHHIHGMDMGKWFHGVLDEFEGRYQGGGNSSLRWDGEAWYGGDYNRIWLKSEGTMTRGRVRDGDQELLYSRAISTYFNLQGGVRLDLDSGPTRAWGAVGVEGLALYQFEIQATGYFNDRGVAGRLEGSYDILLTNRLILQPQVELNFYSHADRQRMVGSGLADIDTGLRLRYELWRKMAPYVAVTYDSPLMQGRHMARQKGERASEARFTFGIRSWF